MFDNLCNLDKLQTSFVLVSLAFTSLEHRINILPRGLRAALNWEAINGAESLTKSYTLGWEKFCHENDPFRKAIAVPQNRRISSSLYSWDSDRAIVLKI